MGRIISIIIGLPVSVLVIALAVANRKLVFLSLDPFSPDDPAMSVTVPLFAIIFAATIFGVIIGGMTTWARQGRYRSEARRARRELKDYAAVARTSGPGLPVIVRR